MVNFKDQLDKLGQQVHKRNKELPCHLMDKIDNAIHCGEDNMPNPNSTVSAPYFSISAHTPPQNEEEQQLPVCKNSHIPAPNVILRSSLFGIVKKGTRQYEEKALKGTFNGYMVKYTGKQLDQSDLDVWLECLQLCQSTPLGCTVKFTAHNFLLSIGRKTGKSDHEWLKEVFLRLRVNDVEISDGKYAYTGSLIFEQYRDEETGENCLVLNTKIANCFSDASWTGISKIIRMQLKGKPLTLWLYGFYSSHKKPLQMKVITIKELCGSINNLKDFKYKLKKSLSELSAVTSWHCSIDEHDLILVKK